MNYSDNLEHLVIGSLIRYPELITELELKSDMFTDPYAINFIKHIELTDKLNLHEIYAKSMKHEADFVPSELIKQLRKDDLIKKTFFKQYQIEVLELYKARMMSKATSLVAGDPTRQNVNSLKETIQELDTLQISKKDNKLLALNQITRELNFEVEPQLFKTGYKQLDNVIGGFEPGQLIILAGRPSTGKTAFALNLALQLEQNGNNIALFSLETTTKKIIQRFVSSMARVKLNRFKDPNSISDDERLKLTEAMTRFKDMNITINADEVATPLTISRTASKMSQESERNVIIIDYLTLMKSNGTFRDRRLEVEDISRKLKIIAKQFNCVVIALSQLSRGVESRNDKRPMMSDLREAGGIEQDADMIFLLYRDDYYNKATEYDPIGKSEVECIIAKSKDTEIGTVLFQFYKPVQRFY